MIMQTTVNNLPGLGTIQDKLLFPCTESAKILSIFCLNLIYDIFVKLQLGCHQVAVVQYTFTHKQYTEQHKNNNT